MNYEKCWIKLKSHLTELEENGNNFMQVVSENLLVAMKEIESIEGAESVSFPENPLPVGLRKCRLRCDDTDYLFHGFGNNWHSETYAILESANSGSVSVEFGFEARLYFPKEQNNANT
jgi:hypothetical protein